MDQDHTKEQIKADLTFAHDMMMSTAALSRLKADEVEHERIIAHALSGRAVAARQFRGLTGEAALRYRRMYIEPQYRRLEAAKVASAAAHTQRAAWSRAYDDCIDRASAYRGHTP